MASLLIINKLIRGEKKLPIERRAVEISYMKVGLKVAPHSSTLAWKILWAEEPGGLQSMGSLRVRHD